MFGEPFPPPISQSRRNVCLERARSDPERTVTIAVMGYRKYPKARYAAGIGWAQKASRLGNVEIPLAYLMIFISIGISGRLL